jgi:hypothetical protein
VTVALLVLVLAALHSAAGAWPYTTAKPFGQHARRPAPRLLPRAERCRVMVAVAGAATRPARPEAPALMTPGVA